MDYKEKYNKLVEAVKVLQEANPSDEGIQNWVNDNVPELRESENEKIRKELIHLVKKSHEQGGYALHKYEADRMIAWLEKQGEQNPFDYENAKIVPKDFAPKPIWGDKDDSMFQSCIGAVATNDYYKGEEKEQIYDWLKSLKQRIGGSYDR